MVKELPAELPGKLEVFPYRWRFSSWWFGVLHCLKDLTLQVFGLGFM